MARHVYFPLQFTYGRLTKMDQHGPLCTIALAMRFNGMLQQQPMSKRTNWRTAAADWYANSSLLSQPQSVKGMEWHNGVSLAYTTALVKLGSFSVPWVEHW